MNLVKDVVDTIQTRLEEAIADAKDDLVEEAAERIKDHLEGQPYKVECAVCGDAVDVTSEVDSDGDLLIYVDPCSTCLKKAVEEGAA